MQRENLIHFWKQKKVDERLLQAFREVPREIFVAEDIRHHAYEDRPLPTLRGQSLSQPTTVMIMTQALDLEEGMKVLEVGAGVGYQAALLGKLVGHGQVFTTEIIPELVSAARENISQLGVNVTVEERDGSRGLPEKGPFDRVLITCACPRIPDPIIEQTKEGGIIVAPIGDQQEQMMVRAVKQDGRLDIEILGSFVFVPMQGKFGLESFKEV
jgi:protein-L-isoaspartate(D-aspartate) O-methyltransferase